MEVARLASDTGDLQDLGHVPADLEGEVDLCDRLDRGRIAEGVCRGSHLGGLRAHRGQRVLDPLGLAAAPHRRRQRHADDESARPRHSTTTARMPTTPSLRVGAHH